VIGLDSVTAAKRLARRQSKVRRHAAAAAATGAGADLRDRFVAALVQGLALAPGSPVSAYWPLGDEIDSRPLMHRLHELGHPVGLPVVVGPGQALVFRRWHPGMALAEGGFGVMTPPAAAPILTPAVILAPLLAFDRRGYRLGYGGGFYDRTLGALRRGAVLAVGLAFAAQEVAAVPQGAGDEPLDWIVTEREAIHIRPSTSSGRGPHAEPVEA
jgi:5-formyltetrahydrofolate cyclo-ligase